MQSLPSLRDWLRLTSGIGGWAQNFRKPKARENDGLTGLYLDEMHRALLAASKMVSNRIVILQRQTQIDNRCPFSLAL
jgi:hypothetical protein